MPGRFFCQEIPIYRGADDFFSAFVEHPSAVRAARFPLHQRLPFPARNSFARLALSSTASSAISPGVALPDRHFKNSRIVSAHRHASSQSVSSISYGDQSYYSTADFISDETQIRCRASLLRALRRNLTIKCKPTGGVSDMCFISQCSVKKVSVNLLPWCGSSIEQEVIVLPMIKFAELEICRF